MLYPQATVDLDNRLQLDKMTRTRLYVMFYTKDHLLTSLIMEIIEVTGFHSYTLNTPEEDSTIDEDCVRLYAKFDENPYEVEAISTLLREMPGFQMIGYGDTPDC